MNASLFRSPGLTSTFERERTLKEASFRRAERWNPENFAQEQIQGLVRRVFFSNVERPVRQVVFSAVEAETDVRSICRQVGEVLSRETIGSVAVVGENVHVLQGANLESIIEDPPALAGTPLRRIATRVKGNLWLVPVAVKGKVPVTASSLHSYLGEMRREFEYSIVQGPPAGESTEATAMGQFADGIILVLSAHHTRRVTAGKVKEMLEWAKARLLGTVLSDRVFPMPEAIYRRI
jgi:septum formation inhibitor-activating ATPase MinD